MDKHRKNFFIAQALDDPRAFYLAGKLIDSITEEPFFSSVPPRMREYILGMRPDTPQDRYTLQELKDKFGVTEEDVDIYKKEREERREKMLEKLFRDTLEDAEDEEERNNLLKDEEKIKQRMADILFMEDPSATEKFMREEYRDILWDENSGA